VRFLITNDLHVSDRRPESRTDNYIDELFGLLDQIEQAANRLKLDGVLVAGDIFHRKPGISLGVLARLAFWCRRLQELGCPVIIIPGNHDLRYDRYESLLPHPETGDPSTQPLAFLIDLGLVINVSTLRTAGTPLPYVIEKPSTGEKAAFYGVPFPDAFEMDEWVRLGKVIAEQQHDPMTTVFVLGHCFADMDGGDYYGEPIMSYRQLSQFVPADVFAFGHDHSDGGIELLDAKVPHRVGMWRQAFVNLGALSRGTLTDEDISRSVDVAIVVTDEAHPDKLPPTLTRAALQTIPASQLFDLEKRARLKEEHTAITAFVTRLRDDLAVLGTTTDLDAQLTAMSLPAEVRAKVAEYLLAVEATV
jgi:hypothetical protein